MTSQIKLGLNRKPNILITGTPGVGKSTLCKELAKVSKLNWIDISKYAKIHNCLFNYDEENKCPILDEDKLLSLLEETMNKGGNLVDYHSCELFPEKWFDAVYVLRASNTILHERLSLRGYTEVKMKNNIECEIFQIILDEARSCFNKVFELFNNTTRDLENNVKSVIHWVLNFNKD